MRRARLISALVAVPAAVLVVVLASSGSPYIVRAEFANASGLRTSFKVTLGGVTVGKVTKVTLSPRDTALATMEIDKQAAPVGADAAAAIKPTNLLGEKVVQLAPGDLRAPAPSGTLIPTARTSTPTELDDVLDALDGDTRTALSIFLAESGNALMGRGGDLASTLERMPRALPAVRRVLADLGADDRALGELIDRSDRVVAAIAHQRRPLGRLVQSAGGALGTLASRRTALGATVRNAPGAVRQLRASLVALQRAAAPLIPAARGLRAAAPPLTSTLRELAPFTQAAGPALRTVAAVVPSLRRLAGEGTPVVERLGPAAEQLAAFAGSADAATDTVDQGTGDLLGMMEGWARATQNRDGAGHVFRLGTTLSPALLTALNKSFISPTRRRPTSRQRRPEAPALSTPTRRSGDGQRPSPEAPALQPRLPRVTLPALGASAPSSAPRGAPLQHLLDYLLK
jgi:phospholipid/cholesterol/gamma-HCH transport system substrate-binding protein